MLRKKLILLFTFSLLINVCLAQEHKINGLIVVDFKNEHPEGVIITNKQRNETVLTDISGGFSITAQVGDTLYFRGSFLEDRKLVIRKSHFKLNPLVVHMNQEIITLEDVVIRPPITGDLGKDVSSIEKKEEVEQIYANLGVDIRMLDMEPKEKVADVFGNKILGIPIPTSLNINALYKGLTGYYRRLDNLREYEALEKKLIAVKEFFGVKYFDEILGIEEGDIREFLFFLYGKERAIYELSYSQKDFLSLDQIMRSNAVEFKKRLKERNKAIEKE